MSDEMQLTCPVCRARQIPQAACRRCSADMSLYLKALRSEEAARRRYVEACRSGDREMAARALSYLQWLRPQKAHTLANPPAGQGDSQNTSPDTAG